MKILIIDDDEDIREIIEFSFTCEVKCEVVHANSGNAGIEVIKNDNDIDLIVCDYNMPDGNGGVVFSYLSENEINTPYVFCSSDKVEDHAEIDSKKVFGQITKPFVFEGVQTVLATYSRSQENRARPEAADSKYLSISLDFLLKTSLLPCDLFLELKNDKVLKILKAGDKFTEEEHQKYSGKGMKYLLVRRDDFHTFAESSCKRIESILEDEEKDNADKVYDSHSTIMVVAKELGLSEKLVRAAASSVDSALELFKESKDFDELEKHIFRSTKNYLTVHSIALSYIATAILKKTKWDSPETRKKLVLAGFLHDAAIRVPEGEDETTYGSEADFVNFKEHPMETQKIVQKLKSIPPDLDRIILEHHERPDGSGFPRQLDGTQVHPLSSVFIFAHDIVDMIFYLKSENKEVNDESLLQMLSIDDYTSGNFKKCYEAFLEVKIFD